MENDSDYINASYIEVISFFLILIISICCISIKDLYGRCRYIAAQGPIDESLTDFFRMIWELQITTVICAANDIEAGRVRTRLY